MDVFSLPTSINQGSNQTFAIYQNFTLIVHRVEVHKLQKLYATSLFVKSILICCERTLVIKYYLVDINELPRSLNIYFFPSIPNLIDSIKSTLRKPFFIF